MSLGAFIFLAALSVISAVGTVAQRNPVHCLLSLILTLLSIAVIFIGLDAVVVGFLQAIVYAGAIMVLFLFVVWLLDLRDEIRTAPGYLALKATSGVLFAALIAEFFVLVWHAPTAAGAKIATPPGYGSIDSLAIELFSNYLISFEVTSVLLLAAVVGAIALARHEPAPRTAAAEAARDARSGAQAASPIARTRREAAPQTATDDAATAAGAPMRSRGV